MNVAARIGVAAAAASAVGFGAYKMTDFVSDRTKRDHAELDQEVAGQTKAWDSWSTKLEQQFPGRRLDTPADHARFEQFLRDNPEPSWVSVDHADFTKVRLGVDEPIVDDKHFPVEREKSIGYGGVGALGSLGMGGGLLWNGLKSSGSTLSTVGKVAGGAAIAALGVGMIGMLVSDVRMGTNMDGYNALVERVRAEMQ